MSFFGVRVGRAKFLFFLGGGATKFLGDGKHFLLGMGEILFEGEE